MAAIDVLGEVADRLVRGMMFHSDHADLMCFMGMKGLKRYHECGYHDDAKTFRKVHRLGVKHCGMLVPNGDQDSDEPLRRYLGHSQRELEPKDKRDALMTSMQAWCEYEEETVKVYSRAARDLWGMGEATLWSKVFGLQRHAEQELATARKLHAEMEACGYDMCHVLDMQDALHERYHNPCGSKRG